MKFEKIKSALKSLLESFNSVATNKGVLNYDGEELEVGVAVSGLDEEGNEVQVEDGEYYLGDEDGRTLVVESGKIVEIREKEDEQEQPEEEVEASSVNPKYSKFSRVKEAFEESYEEKERQINNAIRDKGYEAYLVEAGDDYAVVDVWNDDEMEYKYLRFAISWDEEGNVIVGEYDEVKPAFVPVQTDVEKVAEEQKQEEEKEEQFETAKEQFKKINEKKSAIDAKFENLSKYLK